MRFKRLLPFLLLLLLASCKKVKDPEFRRIENFRLKNFGLQNAVIGFNATYYNPNNFGVTVKEAEADVYMDSVYLGKFVQDSTISVNKNAEFSLPLSGTIELQTALKLDIRNLATRDILLNADGHVKVGKAGIFVNKPFHYQGKHRLDDIKFK
jgi:LEA14-like dessication related protein